MAVIIRIDETKEIISKDELTLEKMQDIVGGYIQIVPLNNKQVFVCNEEGKMLDLPFNKEATRIWITSCGMTDIIVGNIILAQNKEID